MAWRIHDSVIRGEIDNRAKGVVRGRLWLDGLAEPVTLELEGNACSDLAGCLLKFENPGRTIPLRKDGHLHPLQRGTIGDLTASRKVRVPDVPIEEFIALRKARKSAPEHMGNCLYLEWFSDFNGRVVVEGVDWKVDITPPEWQLTPEENEQRAKDAASGFGNFMQKLGKAIELQQRGQKDPEADWDEHDYEKFMKECDARTDKYMELQEKYGDSDEAEAKIAREMGWVREGEDEGDDENERMSVEEMNRICEEAANEPPPEPDPHREGIDWIRTGAGDLQHPLQHRCFESAMALWHECEDLGVLEEEDYAQFVAEFQITGAKLAGALNGLAHGRDSREGAFVVACLKRALDHLHKAQAGLEKVAPKRQFPEKSVEFYRKELFEIREGILRLMEEFRGRT